MGWENMRRRSVTRIVAYERRRNNLGMEARNVSWNERYSGRRPALLGLDGLAHCSHDVTYGNHGTGNVDDYDATTSTAVGCFTRESRTSPLLFLILFSPPRPPFCFRPWVRRPGTTKIRGVKKTENRPGGQRDGWNKTAGASCTYSG